MIQFRFGGDYDFHTPCPVCSQEVRLRYRYEPEAYEDRRGNLYGACEEPRIIEQECTCLLGDDFAADALDDYLDRPRASLRSSQLRLF